MVVGILLQDKKVLVAQRPLGKPYQGYWEFPGGKIEPQETPAGALKRELYEELGISVTEAQAWIQHRHTYPDKTVMLNLWIVKNFLGQPHGKENQLLRWVDYAELKQLNILEGNKAILTHCLELLT